MNALDLLRQDSLVTNGQRGPWTVDDQLRSAAPQLKLFDPEET